MKTRVLFLSLAAGWMLLNSCSYIPEKAKGVAHFEVKKYAGTWYEIARFDYRFERNLSNVSAQYSLNKKGIVKVLNSGYNFRKNKWEKAEGLAKFRSNEEVAELKVSFFRPFYAGYNVVALDENYRYALVAGGSLDYLWILSRTKSIPEEIKTAYLKKAEEIGYDTSRLIWVEHERNDNPFLKGSAAR